MKEQTVKKKWGGELWFANNTLYCGKLLWIYKGHCSSTGSFHYHKIKDETFLCISGALKIDYEHDGSFFSITLLPKQSFRVPPGMKHRFSTDSEECKFIEASTTHREDDSYRCDWIAEDEIWAEKK